MTKIIALTQGQVAVVDDWWFDTLSAYKWQADWNEHAGSFYATRKTSVKLGKRQTILMHAVIAGTPQGMHTDHINHDTLLNCEANLRICTSSQNKMNGGKHTGKVGYKGTYKHGRGWQVMIMSGGKQCYLGMFDTAEEGARAYDEAAKRLHGEFAMLNFPYAQKSDTRLGLEAKKEHHKEVKESEAQND